LRPVTCDLTVLPFTACTPRIDQTAFFFFKQKTAYEIAPLGEITLSAQNSTFTGAVNYQWSDQDDNVLGNQENISWTAPAEEGNYTIKLLLTDANAETSTDSLNIRVKSPTLPKITLENKQIKVTPFALNNFRFDGGTITAKETDAYIAVDVINKALKLLRFPYHDGAIFLGKYSADTNSIDAYDTISYPKTGIKSFTDKLYSGQAVKIAIMGDSLLTVSSDPEVAQYTWTNLLFNKERAASGFNMPNLDNITVDNYAIAGQTAEHGLTMLTKRVVNPDGTITLKTQSAMDGDYDLYIIGWGANGNTVANVPGFNKIAYMENIMATLKDKNVLIINQSPYRLLPQHLEEDAPLLYNIAESFGCSYADTWSYLWEGSIMNQQDLWATDGVHWGFTGQELYAKAIRSAILVARFAQTKSATNQYQYSDSGIQDITPYFAMDPFDANATQTPIQSDFGYYTNLSFRLNHPNLNKIPTGGYVRYNIPAHIGLVGMLYDSHGDVRLRVTIHGDSNTTIDFPSKASGRESLGKLAEYQTLQAPTTLTIEVLSGTLYLQGIVSYR